MAAKLGLGFPELRTGSVAVHGRARERPTAGRRTAARACGCRGDTVAVACAACYSRLKMANHHIAGDAAVRAKVAQVLGQGLRRPNAVRHLLEILCRDIGLERIAAAVAVR